MLNDRLLQFVNFDLHEVKVRANFLYNQSLSIFVFCLYHPCLAVECILIVQEARKRFDKASLLYDQVCGSCHELIYLLSCVISLSRRSFFLFFKILIWHEQL